LPPGGAGSEPGISRAIAARDLYNGAVSRFARWAPWTWSATTIFLVALVARVAWIATLPNHLIWVDEKEFAEIGRSLAAGDGYISTSYRANPVVPFYLSLFFRAFGDSVLWPRLGQAVIGALTCIALLRFGTLLAGRTAGAIAATLVALYPAHIYLSGVFYVDCIAGLLAIEWLMLTYRTPAARNMLVTAALAGVVFGLSVLTRPTFLIVLPVAIAAFFIVPGARWRDGIATVAAFVVAATLIIAPWTARNYHTYGRFVIVSSGFGDTLWKGNSELSDGGPGDRFLNWEVKLWRDRLAERPEEEQLALTAKYDEVHQRIRTLGSEIGDRMIARDDVLQPIAIELIKADPVRFVRLFFRKVVTLFDAFSETGLTNIHTVSSLTIFVALYFYPLLALGVAGAVMTLPQWRRFLPLLLLIGAWAGAHGILTSCTRFRLPLDPTIFLFSAVALTHILERILGLTEENR
jgi:4-amino-4-deoxy-L-arabinose transferase-like glycosyltransferase